MCNFFGKTERSLVYHMNCMHPQDDVDPSIPSGSTTNNSMTLRKRVQGSLEKNYQSIPTGSNLKYVFKKMGDVYRCDLCPYTSHSEFSLKCHKGHKHNSNTNNSGLPKESNSNSTDMLECDFCSYSTLNEHKLALHKVRRHKITKNVQSVTSTATDNIEIIPKPSLAMQFPFKCNLCNFSGKSIFSLQCHKRRHLRNKKYKHGLPLKKKIITGLSSFNCNLCNFSGKSEHSIRIHKIRGHTNTERTKAALSQSVDKSSSFTSRKQSEENIEPFTPAESVSTVHDTLQFKCDMCPFVGRTQFSLQIHKGRKHKKNTEQSVPSETTGDYGDPELPYKCNMCSFRGETMRSVESHTHYKHSQNKFRLNALSKVKYSNDEFVYSYQCDQCQFTTNTEFNLEWHKRQKHGEPEVDTISVSDDNTEYSINCDICSLSCKSQPGLKRHMNAKHKSFSTQKSDRFNRSLPLENTPHYTSTPIRTAGIQESGQTLPLSSVHDARSENTAYQCDLCPFTGTSKLSLRSHKNKRHGGEKHTNSFNSLAITKDTEEGIHYKCDLCPFKGNSKRSVTNHKSLNHYGETGKDILNLENTSTVDNTENYDSNQSVAPQPEPSNASELNFSCDFCPYTGTSERCLKIHTTKKHQQENITYDDNQDLIYPCDLCTFRGKTPGTIIAHKMQKHTKDYAKEKNIQIPTEKVDPEFNEELPFKCDLCPFRGRGERSVVNHKSHKHPKKSVTNENYTENINIQMPTDEGDLELDEEHPFKCGLCPFRGRSERSVLVHKSHKHPKKSVNNENYTENINIQMPTEEDDLELDEELPFKCGLCPFRGRSERSVLVHKSHKHPKKSVNNENYTENINIQMPTEEDDLELDEELPFKCGLCPFRGRSERSVLVHKSHKHPKKSVNNENYTENINIQMPTEEDDLELDEELPFKCGLCPFRGRSERSVLVHKSHKHPKKIVNNENYTEKINIQMPTEEDDLELDEELPFKCGLCPFRGRSERSIANHKGHKHPKNTVNNENYTEKVKSQMATEEDDSEFDEELPFKCDLCPFRGRGERSIVNHKSHKHPKNIGNQEDISKNSQSVVKEAENEGGENELPYQCDLCSYKGITERSVNLHKGHKHRKAKSRESSSRDHSTRYIPENVQSSHSVTASGDGLSFNCSLCAFIGTSEHSLKIHISKKHQQDNSNKTYTKDDAIGDDLPYQCDLCSFRGKFLNSLKIHKGRIHGSARHQDSENQRPNKRKRAEFNLDQSDSENVPYLVNTSPPSPTPFTVEVATIKCSLCPYLGTSDRNLRVHLAMVHLEELRNQSISENSPSLSVQTDVANELINVERIHQTEIHTDIDDGGGEKGSNLNQNQGHSHGVGGISTTVMIEAEKYHCEVCSYSTNSELGLKIHKGLTHRNVDNSFTEVETPTANIELEEASYECANELINVDGIHQTEIHTDINDGGGETGSNPNQNQGHSHGDGGISTTVMIEAEKYHCEICSYSTNSELGLNIHKGLTHRNVDNSFTEVETPTANIELEEASYKCKLCPYSSGSMDDLTRHKEEKHNE